jgi:hypothetical protein
MEEGTIVNVRRIIVSSGGDIFCFYGMEVVDIIFFCFFLADIILISSTSLPDVVLKTSWRGLAVCLSTPFAGGGLFSKSYNCSLMSRYQIL